MSILEPNPQIALWHQAHQKYEDLKKWKAEVFDPEVQKQVLQRMVDLKLTSDIKQIMKLKLASKMIEMSAKKAATGNTNPNESPQPQAPKLYAQA